MNKHDTLSEIIRSRRSIFPPMYSDTAVSDDLIKDILSSANWAPNHRKTEPWRFQVFTGKALKRLSEYCAKWYKDNTSEAQFNPLKLNKTRQKPLQSSHVIAICMRRDPDESVPEWEEIAAVACAVQNMWLTCTALGLGCYWSTPGSALSANEFLNLPPDQKCLGWFYIGQIKEEISLEGIRQPIEDKTIWHHE